MKKVNITKEHIELIVSDKYINPTDITWDAGGLVLNCDGAKDTEYDAELEDVKLVNKELNNRIFELRIRLDQMEKDYLNLIGVAFK